MNNIIINFEIFAFGILILTFLFYRGDKNMKKKKIDKYLGEKCRILYKEPGEANIHIITGIISNINRYLGTIKIESHHKKIKMKINKILTLNPIHLH